jgi:hypothetical protein
VVFLVRVSISIYCYGYRVLSISRREAPSHRKILAKLELYVLMREHGIGKAELARRLHYHLPQFDGCWILSTRRGWIH